MASNSPTYHRLKSKKRIDELFRNGKALKSFPVLAVYALHENREALHEIGVSVSKKRFKRAVDRNRIKRLLREAFWLNQSLLNNNVPPLAIMFIYVGKEIEPFEKVEQAVMKALNKLNEESQI